LHYLSTKELLILLEFLTPQIMRNISGKLLFPYSLILAISLFSCGEISQFDILIKNGTLIDGLGNSPKKGTIGIRNEKMYILPAEAAAKAPEVIDAAGLVVAPGFVDVHNHTDRSIIDPDLKLNEGFVRQGVTTIVGGPDGYMSPATLRMLIDSLTLNGAGTNVASYIGHNLIRLEVMGQDYKRAPSVSELDSMRLLVQQGMDLGAVGFSTGLMYEPGMYSTTEEVIELAKVVAPYNGVYDSHVRNPVHAFVESDKEVVQIATEAGIPGKMGHLKAVGLHNEGVIREIIQLVETSRAKGIKIVSDQYPYDGAATAELSDIIIIPNDLKDLKVNEPLLKDPNYRHRIKKVSENGENGGFAWLKATGYTSMRITSSKDYPKLVGKYLSEIAEEKNLDPFDAVCDLLLNSKDPVYITLGAIKEHDVQELLVQEWNMVASDGAYIDPNQGGGHPRSTGTFPRVLGHYVRELKLLTLEEGVRKMTSLPADFIGLPSRGRLVDGLAADIVVFDPETIIDRSTYEDPASFATGVKHVLVNGVFVLKDSAMTGNAPGEFLKRER
jgi:N-acyl-D-amino-acid deacylase